MTLQGTPLVQYYIDEAASGRIPTELIDQVQAYNLAIAYDTDQMAYVESSTGRGLDSESINANTICSKAIVTTGGDPLYDALAGSSTVTFEFVCNIDALNGSSSRIFVLADDAGGVPRLGFFGNTLNNPFFYWNGNNVLNNVLSLSPGVRSVIHITVDINAGTSVHVYKDGVEIPGAGPTGGVLNIAAADFLSIFNRETDRARGIEGIFSYAAIYIDALSQSQVTNNYNDLVLNDDLPAVGPTLSTATATPVTATTATGTVDSDTADGTIYASVTQSATPPSEDDIKNGVGADATDSDPGVVGTANFSFTGLVANTSYYIHYVQQEVDLDYSNIVSTTTFSMDTVPDQFDLGVDAVDQANGDTDIESAQDTVAGITVPTPISVTGGEYQINTDGWTAIAGTVDNGDLVQVRGNAPATRNDTTTVTLTIGGVVDDFKILTVIITLSNPIDTATGTTLADIQVDTNVGTTVIPNITDGGTIWWIVTENVGLPSHTQIKGGLDSLGQTAKASGNVPAEAPTTPEAGPIGVTGLDSNTAYVAYFTQEDDDTVEAIAQVGGDGFTTANGSPEFSVPIFLTNLNDQQVQINGTVIDDQGTTDQWCGVWLRAATPTPADIKAGTNAQWFGGARLSTNSGDAQIWQAVGLSQSTDYTVHWLAEDPGTSQVIDTEDFTTTVAAPFIDQPSGVNFGADPRNAQTSVVISGGNFGAVQGTGLVTYNNIPLTVLAWDDAQIDVVWPDLPEDPNHKGTRIGIGGITMTIRVDDGQEVSEFVATAPETDAKFGGIQGGVPANSIFGNDTFVAGDEMYAKWTGLGSTDPNDIAWQNDGSRFSGVIGDLGIALSGIPQGAQLRYRIFGVNSGGWSDSAALELFQAAANANIASVNNGAGVINSSTGNLIKGSELQGIQLGTDADNTLTDSEGTATVLQSVTEVVTKLQYSFAVLDFILEDIRFGAATLSADGVGVEYPLSIQTTVLPLTDFTFVDILDISNADAQFTALAVDDQINYELDTATNAWAVTVDTNGVVVVQSLGDLTADTFDFFIYAVLANTWGIKDTYNYQETAPALSLPTLVSNGEVTATADLTTDKYGQVAGFADGGVAYGMAVLAGATPSHADIVAGTGAEGDGNVSIAVSTELVQLPQITGLTGGTSYEIYMTQEDGAANAALAVVTTGAFSTDAGAPSAPTFSGAIANQTNFETDVVSVDVSGEWTGTVDLYSLTNGTLPAGIVLNTATGVFEGTPDYPLGVELSLVVTASNTGGSTASNSFNWTITSSAPVNVASIADQTDAEADAVNLDTSVAFDEDPATTGEAVVYSIGGGALPPGLSINSATGVITGTSTTGEGVFSGITVQVSNSFGLAVAPAFTWTITSSDPVFAGPIPDQGDQDGVTITPLDTSTFFTGATSYSAANLPAGLSIDTGTGIITGTPTLDGTFNNCTVTGINIHGQITSATFTWIVIEADQAPVWSTVPSQGNLEQRALVFDFDPFILAGLVFTDPTVSLPPGLTIPDPAIPTVSGTPTTPGSFQVVLRAANAGGANETDSAPFTWTINEDLPPTVNVPNDLGVNFAAPDTGVPKARADVVAWLDSATASDLEDGVLTPTDDRASLPTELTAIGSPYTVTWTATDILSQTDIKTADIVVTETVPPTLQDGDTLIAINIGLEL